MERKIDAPERDWLTREQAASYLGLTVKIFDGLVDKGLIRGARKWTHKTKMWPWKAIVIVSWEMELGLIDEKILPPDEA